MLLNTQEEIQGDIITVYPSVPPLAVTRDNGNVVVLSFNVSRSSLRAVHYMRREADISECVSSAWSTVRDCTGENMVCSYVPTFSSYLTSS